MRYRCRVCHDDAIYLRKTAKATLSVIHEELNVLTLLSSDRCSALGSCDLSEVDPLATADHVSRNIVRSIAVSKDCIVMMTTEFTATQRSCYSSIPLDDLRPTVMRDLKDQGASVLAAEDVSVRPTHHRRTLGD